MKRKLVQHGETSIVTSLPIEWIRKNNLKGGNEIEIEESNNDLIISLEKEKKAKQYVIEAEKIDRSTLYLMLLNLYQKGYSEVKIITKRDKIFDYETNKNVFIIEKIKSWLPRFVGWELTLTHKLSD